MEPDHNYSRGHGQDLEGIMSLNNNLLAVRTYLSELRKFVGPLKAQAEKYRNLLMKILRYPKEDTAECLKAFVEAIAGEDVSLMISHPLLICISSQLSVVSDNVSQDVLTFILNIIQPRESLFQEQVAAIKQHLSAIYERNEYSWELDIASKAETKGVPCTSRLVEVCVRDEDTPPELSADVSRQKSIATVLTERRKRLLAKETGETMVKSEMDDENTGSLQTEKALLSGEAASFEWSPMDSFQSTREVFFPQRTGSVTFRQTMYDAFRSYWDDEILEHIVTETNRYASNIPSEYVRKNWSPTNIHEILVLFAFWIMLGIVKMPNIKSCFSCDPLLKTEVFRQMFVSRRYQILCRALHFCNNEATPPNPSRLYLLGPILDHLNSKFQANYIPSQNLYIERHILWKSALLFKQYISNIAATCGIKMYELCESATGYIWSVLVDSGKKEGEESGSSAELKSDSVVLKLVCPLLGMGYTLFMNYWFNSPTLARFLKGNKTDCVGTLRSTHLEVPPLIQLAQLRKGEFLARHAGDVTVMAWQNKKKTCTISTYHGTEQSIVNNIYKKPFKVNFKPQVIVDYSKNMGNVDRKDQSLEPYLVEKKRQTKWYMKIFKHLLNCSTVNSRILLESSTLVKIDDVTSRLQLVNSILERHLSKASSRTKQYVPYSSITVKSPDTVHYPVRIVNACDMRNRSIRLRCEVCVRNGRKNSKTMYKCEQCDIPLCVECFKEFHVLKT